MARQATSASATASNVPPGRRKVHTTKVVNCGPSSGSARQRCPHALHAAQLSDRFGRLDCDEVGTRREGASQNQKSVRDRTDFWFCRGALRTELTPRPAPGRIRTAVPGNDTAVSAMRAAADTLLQPLGPTEPPPKPPSAAWIARRPVAMSRAGAACKARPLWP